MRIFLIISLAFLASCSSTSSYNPTTFKYEINQEILAGKTLKKVVFANVSLSAPPPSYLTKQNRKIRAMTKDFLQKNGYTLLPDYHFENAWKQANRTFGDIFDPTTGEIDINAWRGAMTTLGKAIREQTDADLIIFTDLIVHDVQHTGGMHHMARWYGVNRKPSIIGNDSAMPAGFDWTQAIKAASLMVTIFDPNLNRLFSSRGGIDTLYALNIKSSTPSFVRRKKMLSNNKNIEEGIRLAFHPFITMKNYPGPIIETE